MHIQTDAATAVCMVELTLLTMSLLSLLLSLSRTLGGEQCTRREKYTMEASIGKYTQCTVCVVLVVLKAVEREREREREATYIAAETTFSFTWSAYDFAYAAVGQILSPRENCSEQQHCRQRQQRFNGTRLTGLLPI